MPTAVLMRAVASRGGGRLAPSLLVPSLLVPGLLAALLALAGCDLAPPYHPPQMILPASYAGSGPFHTAAPQDQVPRGPWWEMFGDPVLDRLEQALDAANPTLAAAAESYTQSREIVAEARAGLFPQLTASALTTDNRQSEHRVFRNSPTGPNEQSSNEIAAAASWEPDFWDRIRNETRNRKALAQASAAQLATARLSLEAELASDYVALRGFDVQHAVYQQTLGSYRKAVGITRLRLSGSISSGLDVARAQNQLYAAEALDTETIADRGVLQHAIAVLAGSNPSSFGIAPLDSFGVVLPRIPEGVPSELLQRRPDIAAAERDMAAANAEIGVTRAAFYPDITINAMSGFQDYGFSLASLPNSLWTVGAQAVLPVFEGGLRKAELEGSWSGLAQQADNYRATVLAAFQQVEDGLILTHELGIEERQQHQAFTAAQKVETMTLSLYTGGLDNYLDVTVAQIATLTAQIAETTVETRRLQAALSLVAALGGGWQTARDLPTPDATLPFNPVSPGRQPGDVLPRP